MHVSNLARHMLSINGVLTLLFVLFSLAASARVADPLCRPSYSGLLAISNYILCSTSSEPVILAKYLC